MNRIGAPAARTDKLRAVPAIAGELETLPCNKALFQPNAHQATVVVNAIERAELVRAHIVTCGKMTAEMLEALPAPWAREAILVEPDVNFRDRMKLTGVKMKLVNTLSLRCLNDIGAHRSFFRGSGEFLAPYLNADVWHLVELRGCPGVSPWFDGRLPVKCAGDLPITKSRRA